LGKHSTFQTSRIAACGPRCHDGGRPGIGGDRRRDRGTASFIPACRGRLDLRPICGPRGCGNPRSFHRSARCGDEPSSHTPVRSGARRSHHHPGTSHQRTRVVAAARNRNRIVGCIPRRHHRQRSERYRNCAQRPAHRSARAHDRPRPVPAVPAIVRARRVHSLPEATVVRAGAFRRDHGTSSRRVRGQAVLAEDARDLPCGIPSLTTGSSRTFSHRSSRARR